MNHVGNIKDKLGKAAFKATNNDDDNMNENIQGKLGKVACKASSEIGSCAWRLMGRQPANKSRCLDS